MPDPRDYTIGCVCAVKKELIAAQAFPDEDHGELDSQPANDNNDYTLGRIGKHNGVIVVLPHWEYGLSPRLPLRDQRLGTCIGVYA
ncbi:Uu.00g083000.m01.CDS01 [Anthostomella pinea]|uniref:Uu.00g083000.m01.CDS01 n=1 Tax=Anthostomella pinea TaxID=933095 RepID=A0AAI8VLH8_9PEZI|nr:Uu.00g083000.m01.CDS01 [Anthostomella pinea]